MNRDSFRQYIEKSRDCEQDRLDIAVNRGLHRAKNDRIDSKKIFILAAASVFTFVMCFVLNLEPFSVMAEKYYRSWNEALPGRSEILAGYFNDIAGNIHIRLGGEL